MSPSEAARLANHADSLRRLARALVGDTHAADDLVQETYLLALSKDDVPDGGWLRGVLRNKHRERRRAEGRRARREAGAPDPARAPAPDETAARIDEHRALMDALACVAEPFRTALWLRFFADRTPAQIARTLDVPAATVRTRVHRGLEALRVELDRTHGDRRTWHAILLPLVPTSGTAGLLGGLMAATKSKVVGVCLALALLVGGTVAALQGIDLGDPAPTGSEAMIEMDPATKTAEAEHPELLGHSPSADGVVQPAVGPAGSGRLAPVESEGVQIGGRIRLDPPFDGEPNGSVYVVAKDADAKAEPAAIADWDEHGRFSFTAPEVKGHWIVVDGLTVEGYLRTFVDGDTWDGTPLDLVLGRAPERVIRVVGPDGAGVVSNVGFLPLDVARIRTWARPEDPDLGSWSLPTDEGGVLRLFLPTRNAFVVRVAPHQARGLVAPSRVVEPDETEIEIHLVRTAVIRVILDGWKAGDMPLTGRLTRADLDHDSRPLLSGAELDGTLRFDTGVAPGDHRLEIHSPVHEQTVVEDIRVSRPGEEVVVHAEVRKKAGVGSLRVVVADEDGPLADKTLVQLFLRSHGAPAPTWTNIGLRILDEGGSATLIGRPEGTLDLYVAVRGASPRAGIIHGAWVKDAATETARVQLAAATMWRMPDIGALAIRTWQVLDEHGGELPMFFFTQFGSQSYPGPKLPPTNTSLGPYPEGGIRLHVEDDEGKPHDFALETHSR